MKKKAFSALILLTFLLLNLFVLGFGGIGGKIDEAYGSDSKSDSSISSSNSRGFASGHSGRTSWSFGNAREWGSFAYADEDSAELVIGIKEARPDACDRLNKMIVIQGGRIVRTVSIKEATDAVVTDVPFDLIPSLVRSIEAEGLAEYVEPNMKFQVQLVPNDPYWSSQWGPKKIAADYAWNTEVGDPSVLVAVVDTGIDYTHPDLAPNYVSLGYDWVNMDSDPMDDNGHGTHCAGIVAAKLNNRVGIVGLAQVKIMAEKGFDENGTGYEDDLANAIVHAADQGADIISMSWGGGDSLLIYDAIKYAHDAGPLLVAAAGNEAGNMKHYPAAYEEVIAVTATTKYDEPTYFDNYGDWVELAAPGASIISTMPTHNVTLNEPPYNLKLNYDSLSGTSMACPHVAGVAALIWSRYPFMTRDQVRAQLRATADNIVDPGSYFGFGRINARKSVEQGLPEHDLLVLNWKTLEYLTLGQTATFKVTVLNFGSSNETNVETQLLVNGTRVDSASIASLPSGSSTTVESSWTPDVEGEYNVTFYLVPLSNETIVKNNQITKIAKIVAPPIETAWKLLATDSDEGNGTNLKMVFGQVRCGVSFYKIVNYRTWATIRNINTAIFIDSDQDPNTGCRDHFYPGMNTGIGADYLITVGIEGNDMDRWISTPEHGWDWAHPIPLAYLYAPDYSNVFTVGVFIADLQPNTGVVDAVVCDAPSNWDWMPDSGSFPSILTYYSQTYLAHEWIGGGVPMGWHGDDESWPYTLPFEFPFYDTNYTSIYISSNGLISFNNADSSKNSSILELVNKVAIAPAWKDWTTNSPYDIYIKENSTRTCIRWHVQTPASGATADFEAILDADGKIQFNFASSDSTTPTTIGVSNAEDVWAVEVTNLYYANTVVLTLFKNVLHELVVVDVNPSRTVIGQGYSMYIQAAVVNQGRYTETFNFTIYANETVIKTQEVTLTRGESFTLSSTWNTTGFDKGRYAISANASIVSGEIYTVDNTLAGGTIAVTIPGDVNADGVVNALDAAGISAHWYPGPPVGPLGPDPNFDINNDGFIGIFEASTASAHWTGPPKGPLAP